eukprot:15438037-Alexandrium_andersonii.AAC.1
MHSWLAELSEPAAAQLVGAARVHSHLSAYGAPCRARIFQGRLAGAQVAARTASSSSTSCSATRGGDA